MLTYDAGMADMAHTSAGQSEIILYTTPEGDVKIDVFFQDETVNFNSVKNIGTVIYHKSILS